MCLESCDEKWHDYSNHPLHRWKTDNLDNYIMKIIPNSEPEINLLLRIFFIVDFFSYRNWSTVLFCSHVWTKNYLRDKHLSVQNTFEVDDFLPDSFHSVWNEFYFIIIIYRQVNWAISQLTKVASSKGNSSIHLRGLRIKSG